MSTTSTMSAPIAHNQRAEFAERVRRAHYQEYWDADYRTDKPTTGVLPHVWPWEEMQSLMFESAKVIGIDEAERRGLILANPGLGGKPFMTNSLFGDIQILSPGESAPAHRHTTSASRFVLEGHGCFTTVAGEKCTMAPGDLVINPNWAWHDHGNDGPGEVTYLNVLDVPLVAGLGCTFYDHDYWKEGDTSKTVQTVRKSYDHSTDLYLTGGIKPRGGNEAKKPYSPQLLYRYDQVRPALDRLATGASDPHDGYILEYVNPETGGPVMPTMSFTLQMLTVGMKTLRHRHTSSTVYCVAEGSGCTVVDDTKLEWKKNDVFVVPTWAWHAHMNSSKTPAVLFAVTDAPAISKLSLYREEREDGRGNSTTILPS
jgi:gentisate 1,2-dioxygenase